jgi:hypothetical protein
VGDDDILLLLLSVELAIPFLAAAKTSILSCQVTKMSTKTELPENSVTILIAGLKHEKGEAWQR